MATPGPQGAMSSRREKIALVLQGGGALGAYQGGVYEALDQAGLAPEWIAGISIGAINAALIAGNAPGLRVDRLHEFWMLISSSVTPLPLFEEIMETAFAQSAAANALMFGAPGFFKPRFVNPFSPFAESAGLLSFYDTSDLKGTLERLVDFDRINSQHAGRVRLSVGAVNVETGNFVYFDNTREQLRPEHIMASGALPPGLPPIVIDGQAYWDGGLVSNTPLQYVIDEDAADDLLAFQVDLFSARGRMPENLVEAAEREKDIRFSSRTRLNTDILKQRRAVGAAAQRLGERLPADLRDDPDLAFLRQQGCTAATTIVHLIYKSKHAGGFSKDYEFSRASVGAHWAAGKADIGATLASPAWLGRRAPDPGTVKTFDLAMTEEALK